MLLIALLDKSVLDLIYECVMELTHCRCWNLTCIGEVNLIYTSIKQLSWKPKVSEIPEFLKILKITIHNFKNSKPFESSKYKKMTKFEPKNITQNKKP